MERPKISDYTKDLLLSYDQLSDFSCSQDKYTDQVEAEKKELIESRDSYIELHSKEYHKRLELEAELKEVKEEMERTISNLEDKQKSFLGTEGETARVNFKRGLGWAIESFQTVINKLKQ